MSIDTALTWAERDSPSSSKNPVEGFGVLAFGPPDDLTASMISDQGEVVVVALPGHVVDSDVEQVVETSRIQLVGDDPPADAPYRVPVDTEKTPDGCLVHPGGQERHQCFEVAAEPGPVPGERHPLGPLPMHGAGQTSKLGTDDQPPRPQVEVPPPRRFSPGVIAGPSSESAQRAHQLAASQPHRHRHGVGTELDAGDIDPIEAKKTVEYGTDAHGRTSGSRLDTAEPKAPSPCASYQAPSTTQKPNPHRAFLAITTPNHPHLCRKTPERDVEKMLYRTGCVAASDPRCQQAVNTMSTMDATMPYIAGTGGEIDRTPVSFDIPNGLERFTIRSLLELRGYPVWPEIVERGARWLEDLPVENPLSVLDFHDLEMRFGGWGGYLPYGYPDAARFFFYPFADRRLIEALVTLPPSYRRVDGFTHDVISSRWPELLSFPFNDATAGLYGWYRGARRLAKHVLRP